MPQKAAILRLTLDNWTRQAALRLIDPDRAVADDDFALFLSDRAFARRLSKELGRPLHLISSREYTEYRALATIEYAQGKILEARRLQAEHRRRRR